MRLPLQSRYDSYYATEGPLKRSRELRERSRILLEKHRKLLERRNELHQRCGELRFLRSTRHRHFEEQERKLILLALRLAVTYCDLAETHTHRADTLRLAGRAKDEIATVEQRLNKKKALFGTQTSPVRGQIAVLNKRIHSLEWLAGLTTGHSSLFRSKNQAVAYHETGAE